MIGSIDIGNGYLKATGNGRTWRQPSIIGEPHQLYDSTIKPDDVQLWVGDKDYFIGNLAQRQSLITYFSTADNKPTTWEAKVLLKAALGVIAPRDCIQLVTGLPIDFYFKQKADFEKLLKDFNDEHGFDLQIGKNKRTTCRPYIINYKIVPQPFGSAMNFLLDDTGQIYRPTAAASRILVVDIGYYTLDLLILDGMEISKQSHSPDKLGIDTAYQLIQQVLRQQIGRAPARQELDIYVRSGVYNGFNILPIRAQAFAVLTRQIRAEIESFNMNFDNIIVTGGWASEIAQYLSLPKDKLTIMDGMGNVNGYHKIGVRLWQQKSSAGCEKAKTAIS